MRLLRDANSKLLDVLVLLMLMLRNVLTTVCLVEIAIYLVKTLRLRFGQDFEVLNRF